MSNLFISWSGDVSKELGKELKIWFPKVIQNIKPFFSDEDIEKGVIWIEKIKEELNTNATGILCITRENQDSFWIHFEAGALSGGLSRNKVIPLLFDVEKSQLKRPLGDFNATKFDKADFYKLLKSLNNSLDEQRLEDDILEESFEKWWPDLEIKVLEILKRNDSDSYTRKRSTEENIEDILINQKLIYNALSVQKIENRETLKYPLEKLSELYSSLSGIQKKFELKLESIITGQENIYFTRPIKIEGKVYRFKIDQEIWIYVLGLIDNIPKEIFIGNASGLFLPGWVKDGWIIQIISKDKDHIRYDFSFEDKDGYRVTVEGLNRNLQNDFYEYTLLISTLLSNRFPLSFILKLIDRINLRQIPNSNYWKKGIKHILKIYL